MMDSDQRLPYRDPLDADDTVSTDRAAAIGDDVIERDRATLLRDVTVHGRALLAATDALLASALPDPIERAIVLASLTDEVEKRRNVAITALVVDGQVPVRQVADRLGWTTARVAFACKTPRQR